MGQGQNQWNKSLLQTKYFFVKPIPSGELLRYNEASNKLLRKEYDPDNADIAWNV